MKNSTALIVSLLFFYITEAQQIKNIAIQTNYENTVYPNVQNHLNIIAEGVKFADLTVSVNQGQIIKKSNDFIFIPEKTGFAEIKIIDKGDLIDTKFLNVTEIPEPEILIGKKNGGIVSKKDILSVSAIKLNFKNPFLDTLFILKEFTLSGEINGKTENHISHTNSFTPQQIQFVNRLRGGNLTVKNIKITANDQRNFNLKNQAVFVINSPAAFFYNGEQKLGEFVKLNDLIQGKITIKIQNSVTDFRTDIYNLKSFDLTFTEGADVIMRSFAGNFSAEMLNAIKNAKTNVFYLKNLNVYNTQSSKYEFVENLRFIISER